MRFLTRQHLFKYLLHHAPRRAIARAIDHKGTVLMLGSFSQIPPSKYGGWVAEVESPWCVMKWYIAVLTGPGHIEGKTFVVEEVPWKLWTGDKANSEVAIGDCYDLCKHMKEKAK